MMIFIIAAGLCDAVNMIGITRTWQNCTGQTWIPITLFDAMLVEKGQYNG